MDRKAIRVSQMLMSSLTLVELLFGKCSLSVISIVSLSVLHDLSCWLKLVST